MNENIYNCLDRFAEKEDGYNFVFYMGSSGSGKTTHSKVWTHVQFLNGDAIMVS
jgi:chromosomal replication initiation ATPase DnaA